MKSTMFTRIRRSLGELRSNASGNTALIMAAGMPALIGGAGLAVDTAQWFMWKREMQNAVDQAAIAGAWSRVNGSTGNDYQTRAQQELTSNLQIANFSGSPTIALQNYKGGSDNSVVVSMSGTKTLPFTSLLTQRGVTVAVSAQAVFEKGNTFTSCLIAVDPDTKGAITVFGNAYVVADCGAAALSDNDLAVNKDGNGVFHVGWIVSAGGIDGDFNDGQTQLFPDQQGLQDPFGSLTPPTGNGISRSLSCTPIYTATFNDTTTTVTKTYEGTTSSNLSLVSTSSQTSGNQVKTTSTNIDNKTKVGDTIISTTTPQTGQVNQAQIQVTTTTTTGHGNNAVTTTTTSTVQGYRRIDTTTTETGTVTAISQEIPHAKPGTYTDFTVGCNTVMDSGVYVINGGQFASSSQYTLDGSAGVMIVLKNGAGIRINGGSTTYLRAMTTTEMTVAGIPEADAIKLKDMLIFEDRNSSGDDNDKVNGNSGITLDGTVYLPKSKLTFNGTASVVTTGRCLILASKELYIGGDAYMTSFCKTPDQHSTISVGGGAASVRLVS